MRKYVSKDVKAMAPAARITGIVICIALIVTGVAIKSWSTIVVGAIILAALAMQKEIAMTDAGLETNYDLFFIKHQNLWKYDEIKEIHKELSANGEVMTLHIMKDIMSKRVMYSRSQYQAVIDMALEHNPKIHVEYVDK